ncbi:hypothetical protein HMPREF2531_03170 [Bacteroides intestinalis]|uniref:Uncharacterized protein n=1 Tax=Bacteroides intestinalis TaxID=329854 RepID=A0A139L4L0_9BACE|nr:hypothetical protein HMPREF2531_03170 [Bacteroides intestinalis]
MESMIEKGFLFQGLVPADAKLKVPQRIIYGKRAAMSDKIRTRTLVEKRKTKPDKAHPVRVQRTDANNYPAR